jgi:hypothetical protein
MTSVPDLVTSLQRLNAPLDGAVLTPTAPHERYPTCPVDYTTSPPCGPAHVGNSDDRDRSCILGSVMGHTMPLRYQRRLALVRSVCETIVILTDARNERQDLHAKADLREELAA